MSDPLDDLRTKWEFLTSLDDEAAGLAQGDMTDPKQREEFFLAMQEVRDHSYELFCILREAGGLSIFEPAPEPVAEPTPEPTPEPVAEKPRLKITARELLEGMTTSTRAPTRPLEEEARIVKTTLDYLTEPFEEDKLVQAMELRSKWADLPSYLLRPLMAALTCYAKHLQDSGLMTVTQGYFRVLTAIASDKSPGYIHGLAAHHDPKANSWAEDFHGCVGDLREEIATLLPEEEVEPEPTPEHLNPEVCLDVLSEIVTKDSAEAVIGATATCLEAGVSSDDPRLVKLLIPWLSELQAEPRFKNLRRAIRAHITPEDEESGVPEAPGPDWPFWHLTRGKKCLAVANKANHEASARMIEAFGFSEVEWLAVDPRRVESADRSLRAGKYGFVMFTRFRDHASDVLKDVCVDNNIPWVMLNAGYGVSALKNEIEEMNAGKVA